MITEKIKVLHIIKSLGRGGAEMLLPETLKLHNKHDFEFHCVYFLPWKNQMEESIRANGGTVTCFDAKNNLQLMTKVWAVAQYIRDHKIQIIHAHLPWAGILARVVGKMTGVPVIYTEHNKQERYHVATRVMNLLTMDFLTKVIAVSSDVEDSIRKHKPRLKAPVIIIANAVNTEHFKRQLFDSHSVRQRFGIPADAFVIGTISVFRFQKRLTLWMELAAKILQDVKDAHFIIVGDGPLKNELIHKRDALGLSERIHMPGLETEVRPYLASLDVYMMSSVFEGLPVAMLEAMAMECAVIATDAGGTKEVVRHEIEGLICAVDDPEKLIEYARTLWKDPALRIKYGAQSRKRVVEAFGMMQMVNKLESVYREAALVKV